MKLFRHAIAFAAIFTSTQALSVTSEHHDVSTTGDLVELCSVSTGDPLFEAAMGFCLGYIEAAMDYHAALTAGPKYDAIVCPPTTVTREQVIVVFMDWSKGNAQHLQGETPVHGVMRAIVEKWPCSK
jgi:hypothetical protein